MARLIVASNQIGCLLGKGGSIIAEMRKLSGASIRIVGKDQIPKCATEDEEVVLVRAFIYLIFLKGGWWLWMDIFFCFLSMLLCQYLWYICLHLGFP